jgi:hypothetical protein
MTDQQIPTAAQSLIGTTLRDHGHSTPWTAAQRIAEALVDGDWQITPAGELDRITAELAALRAATCPRCEGCDQPMPEPNTAGDWCCTDCTTKAQAYWAARPQPPF